MSGIQSARGHKFTAKCPKCNYTSKIPLLCSTNYQRPNERTFKFDKLNNSNSVHSKNCPKHRLKLERI